MSEFIRFTRQRQLTLSLDNAGKVLDQEDLDAFLVYVNQVSFNDQRRDFDQYSVKRAVEGLELGAKKHGLKIIRPFRILLMRMLNDHFGFTKLHSLFLKFCNRFSVPKEALPILQYPGLFKNASKNIIAQFITEGCDIFIKLRQYSNASQLLQKGIGLQLYDHEKSLPLLQRAIILTINKGEEVPYELKDRLKSIKLRYEDFIAKYSTQKKKISDVTIIQFYLGLNHYRELQPVQQDILRQDGLLDVYNASNWAILGSYIRKEIRQNNWRIKADSIQNCPVSSIEAVQGLNQNEQTYRYDAKNKIMYFNHQESNQDKLNKLITKTMDMTAQLVNAKNDRSDSEGLGGMRLGGIGGMMGMMGMMGMRGMGGMGRGFG